MKKLIKIVPLFLIITGCATTSNVLKPEMSQQEYEERSMRYAHFGTCLRLGYMDSSTYGKAMSLSERGANASFSNINTQKLDGMTRAAERSVLEYVRSMPKEELGNFKYECQSLSGMIETNYAEMQELERNNSLQRPNIIYSPVQSKSSTTSCNQFGSQVICNSY